MIYEIRLTSDRSPANHALVTASICLRLTRPSTPLVFCFSCSCSPASGIGGSHASGKILLNRCRWKTNLPATVSDSGTMAGQTRGFHRARGTCFIIVMLQRAPMRSTLPGVYCMQPSGFCVHHLHALVFEISGSSQQRRMQKMSC